MEQPFPDELMVQAADVPLDGLFAALEQLERQEVAGKVMIIPRLRD